MAGAEGGSPAVDPAGVGGATVRRAVIGKEGRAPGVPCAAASGGAVTTNRALGGFPLPAT